MHHIAKSKFDEFYGALIKLLHLASYISTLVNMVRERSNRAVCLNIILTEVFKNQNKYDKIMKITKLKKYNLSFQ